MALYLAFCFAALMVTLSPGPDTFLVMANAARGGARLGLATVAGIVSGGVFHIALFAGGFAQLLVYSAAAFLAVKVAGAAYLGWLGLQALRSAARPAQEIVVTTDAPATTSVWPVYAQGVLTNALNPKIAVFYLAFLPQFMDPAQSLAAQSVLLIGTHYVMGFVWLGALAFGAARMGPWLAKGRVRRWLDGVVGTVMLAFGVRLALTTR
ncbi:LysE family translocator [Tahibacter amnicola]|uniref:LysE family translocator n=1 Tax=Tahibacter amnicola TaxID=2976241 RepID=A0ABY6BK18_9GAMM|nr:LysE family translocator [Tahibacter amnicola]UXI69817.1 LysE family translocator [Tahibacter amnicola]